MEFCPQICFVSLSHPTLLSPPLWSDLSVSAARSSVPASRRNMRVVTRWTENPRFVSLQVGKPLWVLLVAVCFYRRLIVVGRCWHHSPPPALYWCDFWKAGTDFLTQSSLWHALTWGLRGVWAEGNAGHWCPDYCRWWLSGSHGLVSCMGRGGSPCWWRLGRRGKNWWGSEGLVLSGIFHLGLFFFLTSSRKKNSRSSTTPCLKLCAGVLSARFVAR